MKVPANSLSLSQLCLKPIEQMTASSSNNHFSIGAAIRLTKSGNLAVVSVVADGPCGRAGVCKGDVVLAVDCQPVSSLDEIASRLALCSNRAKVCLTLRTAATSSVAEVTLHRVGSREKKSTAEVADSLRKIAASTASELPVNEKHEKQPVDSPGRRNRRALQELGNTSPRRSDSSDSSGKNSDWIVSFALGNNANGAQRMLRNSPSKSTAPLSSSVGLPAQISPKKGDAENALRECGGNVERAANLILTRIGHSQNHLVQAHHRSLSIPAPSSRTSCTESPPNPSNAAPVQVPKRNPQQHLLSDSPPPQSPSSSSSALAIASPTWPPSKRHAATRGGGGTWDAAHASTCMTTSPLPNISISPSSSSSSSSILLQSLSVSPSLNPVSLERCSPCAASCDRRAPSSCDSFSCEIQQMHALLSKSGEAIASLKHELLDVRDSKLEVWGRCVQLQAAHDAMLEQQALFKDLLACADRQNKRLQAEVEALIDDKNTLQIALAQREDALSKRKDDPSKRKPKLSDRGDAGWSGPVSEEEEAPCPSSPPARSRVLEELSGRVMELTSQVSCLVSKAHESPTRIPSADQEQRSARKGEREVRRLRTLAEVNAVAAQKREEAVQALREENAALRSEISHYQQHAAAGGAASSPASASASGSAATERQQSGSCSRGAATELQSRGCEDKLQRLSAIAEMAVAAAARRDEALQKESAKVAELEQLCARLESEKRALKEASGGAHAAAATAMHYHSTAVQQCALDEEDASSSDDGAGQAAAEQRTRERVTHFSKRSTDALAATELQQSLAAVHDTPTGRRSVTGGGILPGVQTLEGAGGGAEAGAGAREAGRRGGRNVTGGVYTAQQELALRVHAERMRLVEKQLCDPEASPPPEPVWYV